LSLISHGLDKGRQPNTIRNALRALGRVYNLLQREGRVDRNPATRIGELMRRVRRQASTEAEEVQSWTRKEAETLLEVAREHEPAFALVLHFLLATGARLGESLGLHWSDVNFEKCALRIRRQFSHHELSPPKGGKARTIQIPVGLAEELLTLLAQRRRGSLAGRWPEVPEPVFCSLNGAYEQNIERKWGRVRRRAQARGVRPLRLHCARHTFATLALESGASIRRVSEQLGHSDPGFTLRVYAHALPRQQRDLGFVEFGPGRPYTAPDSGDASEEDANPLESLVPPAGLEPATHGLGNRRSIP